MTTSPQRRPAVRVDTAAAATSNGASAATHPPYRSPASAAPPLAPSRRKPKGDIHVGTMAGDVRPVPGSGTESGDKAIADVMRDVLDRVRRSIRERANSRRRP